MSQSELQPVDETRSMMKEYERAIEYYASKKIDNLMHNGGSEQALIVFKNIFKNSNSHIRIAAGSLNNNEVVNTNDYISAIKTFLENNDSKLDILLTNFDDSVREQKGTNFFKFIKDSKAYTEGRIRIKDAEGQSFKIGNDTIHFCTSDSTMYRIEIDIQLRKARCNFGDTDTTKKLESIFDSHFQSIGNSINL